MSRALVDRVGLVSGPALRRVSWVAFAATTSLCLAVVGTQAVVVDERLDLLPAVRITVVLIAAVAATCIDDPCGPLLDTTPFGRLRRRRVAAMMAGLASLLAGGLVLWGASTLSRRAVGPPLPLGGLLIELAAVCAFGWMVATRTAADTTGNHRDVQAAVAVLVAALLSRVAPRVAGWLWASPGPGWGRAHRHWAIVGLVSMVLFLRASRDSATRSARRRT